MTKEFICEMQRSFTIGKCKYTVDLTVVGTPNGLGSYADVEVFGSYRSPNVDHDNSDDIHADSRVEEFDGEDYSGIEIEIEDVIDSIRRKLEKRLAK